METKDKSRGFGALVRELREEKEISLRRFAEMIGKSPTYISMIERDEVKSPPTEDVIRTIAKALDRDADEMLAMIGKVSSDLSDTIIQNPKEMAAFLRMAKGLPSSAIQRFTSQAQSIKSESRVKPKI